MHLHTASPFRIKHRGWKPTSTQSQASYGAGYRTLDCSSCPPTTFTQVYFEIVTVAGRLIGHAKYPGETQEPSKA